MRITLLGTGCPTVSTERYGPAQVLSAGSSNVLVDCGSGVTQRLVAAGVPGRELDAVLLTHLHSDHIVDLFQLVVSSWHQGRDRPQRIFGPRGTRRYVDGLMDLWRPELEQRIAHEQRPSTTALQVEVTEVAAGETLTLGAFRIAVIEVAAGETLTLGAFRIAVIEVDHKPVTPAFGFVFQAGGRRIALSGDTRACPALIAAARGADILVHDVFVHREMPVIEGRRSA